jgi:phytanoyl-CoA hydroxylase
MERIGKSIQKGPFINMGELKSLKNDGYMVLREHLDSEKIKQINAEIDHLQNTLDICDDVFDEDGTGKIKQIQYLYNKGEKCNELLKEMKELASVIIGINYPESMTKFTKQYNFQILNMQLFEKHPQISKHTRSHQDNAYFKVTPTDAFTIWIALDDIDEENGCLYYAPKSHIRPTHKHSIYHNNTTFRVRSGVPELSLCLHEHPEETDVPVKVKAGDVLVHNCNTIHRAGKNNSNRQSRAIGVIVIPNHCKHDPLLHKYHNKRLQEDIELQKIKDPEKYREAKEKYSEKK